MYAICPMSHASGSFMSIAGGVTRCLSRAGVLADNRMFWLGTFGRVIWLPFVELNHICCIRIRFDGFL